MEFTSYLPKHQHTQPNVDTQKVTLSLGQAVTSQARDTRISHSFIFLRFSSTNHSLNLSDITLLSPGATPSKYISFLSVFLLPFTSFTDISQINCFFFRMGESVSHSFAAQRWMDNSNTACFTSATQQLFSLLFRQLPGWPFIQKNIADVDVLQTHPIQSYMPIWSL